MISMVLKKIPSSMLGLIAFGLSNLVYPPLRIRASLIFFFFAKFPKVFSDSADIRLVWLGGVGTSPNHLKKQAKTVYQGNRG